MPQFELQKSEQVVDDRNYSAKTSFWEGFASSRVVTTNQRVVACPIARTHHAIVGVIFAIVIPGVGAFIPMLYLFFLELSGYKPVEIGFEAPFQGRFELKRFRWGMNTGLYFSNEQGQTLTMMLGTHNQREAWLSKLKGAIGSQASVADDDSKITFTFQSNERPKATPPPIPPPPPGGVS